MNLSLSLFFISVFIKCNFLEAKFENGKLDSSILDNLNNINLEEFFNTEEIRNTAYQIKNLQYTGLQKSNNGLSELHLFPYPPSADAAIIKHGYPCEIHDIVTEDGYILTVFRIPYGRKGNKLLKNNVKRPPLLLQHGIFCSADCWILSDPSKGLAYRLADEGFDVWIGNSRGTTYSKKHKTLSIEDAKYWNFSVHELGTKDLPAVIDYMLDKTGYKKITYVGHSQGTTQFFILASTLPEYNDKITVMSALGPVAFLDHLRGFLKVLTSFSTIIDFFAHLFGIHDILQQPTFIHVLGHLICTPNSILLPFCEYWFFIIVGFDAPQMNKTLVEVITDYCPAGGSVMQLEHFSQIAKNNRFAMFDYGPNSNPKIYNSKLPPAYNVTQITVPVILHYAQNDNVATEPDVKKLAELLPYSVGPFLVPYDKFNHIDFMWAKDVNLLLYNDAIYTIKKYL